MSFGFCQSCKRYENNSLSTAWNKPVDIQSIIQILEEIKFGNVSFIESSASCLTQILSKCCLSVALHATHGNMSLLISPLLPLKMGGLIFGHTGYLVALSRKHCCYFTQLLGGLRGLLSLLCIGSGAPPSGVPSSTALLPRD